MGDNSFDPTEMFMLTKQRQIGRRIIIEVEGGSKNTRVAEGKQQTQRAIGDKSKS